MRNLKAQALEALGKTEREVPCMWTELSIWVEKEDTRSHGKGIYNQLL